jgi:hypothetical protein
MIKKNQKHRIQREVKDHKEGNKNHPLTLKFHLGTLIINLLIIQV